MKNNTYISESLLNLANLITFTFLLMYTNNFNDTLILVLSSITSLMFIIHFLFLSLYKKDNTIRNRKFYSLILLEIFLIIPIFIDIILNANPDSSYFMILFIVFNGVLLFIYINNYMFETKNSTNGLQSGSNHKLHSTFNILNLVFIFVISIGGMIFILKTGGEVDLGADGTGHLSVALIYTLIYIGYYWISLNFVFKDRVKL